MNDGKIDEVLQAARSGEGPAPETLRRIADSIRPSLRPVRPLPPRWMLTGGLILVCAAVAILGAARVGFLGFEKMDAWERALIFSTLALFAWTAGNELVSTMIPGCRRRVSAGVLLGAGCAALIAVFALSFRDYHTEHFVSAGIACLITGLLHAVPAALLSWLVLRRGFAVNPVSAGLIAGALAGLAGLGVLELHCSNFEAPHVLLWHTAVVPVSAALGSLTAWALRPRRG